MARVAVVRDAARPPAEQGYSAGVPALSARKVGIRFSSRTILSGIDLDIAAGSFVCLIGPSGSGKTTLLRLLGGLACPSEGAVFNDEKPLIGPKRRLAFVFQDYGRALLPWRTVRANIELALEARGVPQSEKRGTVDKLLDQVGLSHAAQSYPRQLSGGMQQRTQIARALAQEPEVLLMDEPFGALDAMTRQSLQDELLRLSRERGITVVFVTHDIEEAIYLGDRVIALSANPGRIAEEIDIDLPCERNQLTTRESPRFLQYRHHLYELITGLGR